MSSSSATETNESRFGSSSLRTLDHLPNQVIKRNGSYVPFDANRIERAIRLCYASFEGEEEQPTITVEAVVLATQNMIAHKYADTIPTVEQVQDLVENALLGVGEFEAARRYIIYRAEHTKNRVLIPAEVQEAFDKDKKFFPAPVQQFMFYDKYSRFNWDLMRRETWEETIDRNVEYLRWLVDSEAKVDLPSRLFDRIRTAFLNMDVMPSMRSLSQAGEAAKRNSIAIYNCSYIPVIDIDCFAEAMLVSMGGCGVGFSVERNNVERFPRIQRQTGEKLPVYVIEDSTDGWANSLRVGLRAWFEGKDVDFDYSQLRRAGTPLKTKGGTASGPGPLREVLTFCRTKVLSRQGSYLRTIDAHDMMCVVGGAAVSGGVRRTAMISLFDHDDYDMRTCKDGAKLDANPWRWNANNSAVWPEGFTQIDLLHQFTEMFDNHRGEPGIFSRENAQSNAPARRKSNVEYGCNPCGEINLRPFSFCNLSIAVARNEDTEATLREKVELATIVGTIQSLATNFPGLRPEWKENCEEERLLGVDISGQQDCPVVQSPVVLGRLKQHAIEVNAKYARLLGINRAAAITCNKPNGNSSLLLDCSAGIHARWSEFYVRRVRVSPNTPIYQVLRSAGVPLRPENGQTEQNATSWVASFPMKSPPGAKTRKDRSAIEQCEYWLMNKLHWTEHNPSVTITYRPDEMITLAQWVWEHRTLVGGMAFLPADEARYEQMPYEEITKEDYERLIGEFPDVDFALLYAYEYTDMTTAAQELACMAGSCEV